MGQVPDSCSLGLGICKSRDKSVILDNKTVSRSNMIMDDIFYMSSKNVSIKDINEIAKRMNVKNTFMSETSDVVEIEYSDNIAASWFCMRLEDFQEAEDKKFLIENKIRSIFCISHHSNNFRSILPHLKMILQEYDGWIGNDKDGFQPCYDTRKSIFKNLTDMV